LQKDKNAIAMGKSAWYIIIRCREKRVRATVPEKKKSEKNA
jgi:hypothetical protein